MKKRRQVSALILFLLVVSLGAQAQGDFKFDPVADAWKEIRSTILLMKQGNITKLSGRVIYPLSRENPLPDINNRRQFIARYHLLFDSLLLRKLYRLHADDVWEHDGCFTFGTGDVWFEPDGSIIGINYYSRAEKRLGDSLTREVYRKLYPGIGHWTRNLLVCRTAQLLIRVDELEEGIRYIAWGNGKTISDKPDIVLYDGVEAYGGGPVNDFSYTFKSGDWTYVLEEDAYAEKKEEMGVHLWVLKNNRKVADYPCKVMK